MPRLTSSRVGPGSSHFAKLSSFILLSLVPSLGFSQKVGNLYAEVHPSLSWSKCGSTGTCTTQAGKVVLDVGKRPMHTSSNQPCRLSDGWVLAQCPANNSPVCTSGCYVDGANYVGSYGVMASGNSITLQYKTQSANDDSVGSRVYLMDTTDTKYEIFKLLNKEIAFDVDTSKVPCGLKGSLYFVAMDEDGGKAKHGSAFAVAGPKYGTGYCDAKCARSTVWINGQANPQDYLFDPNGPGGTQLEYGSCCAEIDVWNANSVSTQLSLLPCENTVDQIRCFREDCYPEQSTCDPNGCDFNPYRVGATNFYGPGKTVNSNSKMTVVTRFITNDGTENGELVTIERTYVQNGVVIANANVNIPGVTLANTVTENFCTTQKTVFGEHDRFFELGGLQSLAHSMRKGMVLTMSIGDDYEGHMLWLDSNYPVDQDPSTPGNARGTCSTSTGYPPELEQVSANARVIFSNIRFGDIGKTGAIPTTVPPPVTPPVVQTCSNGGQPLYQQCGGIGWTGPLNCCPTFQCWYHNLYYSQCLPNDYTGPPTNP